MCPHLLLEWKFSKSDTFSVVGWSQLETSGLLNQVSISSLHLVHSLRLNRDVQTPNSSASYSIRSIMGLIFSAMSVSNLNFHVLTDQLLNHLLFLFWLPVFISTFYPEVVSCSLCLFYNILSRMSLNHKSLRNIFVTLAHTNFSFCWDPLLNITIYYTIVALWGPEITWNSFMWLYHVKLNNMVRFFSLQKLAFKKEGFSLYLTFYKVFFVTGLPVKL